MNSPENNDPLDTILRDQNAYIDDNGFTARMLATLPRRRRPWLRSSLLLAATLVGYVLAISWVPWDLLKPALLLSLNPQAVVAYVLALVILGSLLWGVTAAFAGEE